MGKRETHLLDMASQMFCLVAYNVKLLQDLCGHFVIVRHYNSEIINIQCFIIDIILNV